MDYEKAYNEALERANKFYKANTNEGYRQIFEEIFPELKESDDERIVDAIRKALESKIEDLGNGVTKTACLAWLEKQGSQNLANSAKTCKVEPKFKAGDWLVHRKLVGETFYITQINEPYYYLTNLGSFIKFGEEDNYRLWTIQDAKDGDVLVTEKGNPFIYDKNRYNNGLVYYYAGLDVNKELTLKGPHHMLAHFGRLRSVFPATKEQHDLLFQKMKEAGYEWDANKKELRKIEQRSAWSKEDEEMLNKCIEYASNIVPVKPTKESGLFVDFKRIPDENAQDWLKSLKDRVQPQPKSDWNNNDEISFNRLMAICADERVRRNSVFSEKEIKDLMDWLESIKKRAQPQWKPSDEQMEYLAKAITTLGNEGDNKTSAILCELRTDLKKLKE